MVLILFIQFLAGQCANFLTAGNLVYTEVDVLRDQEGIDVYVCVVVLSGFPFKQVPVCVVNAVQ